CGHWRLPQPPFTVSQLVSPTDKFSRKIEFSIETPVKSGTIGAKPALFPTNVQFRNSPRTSKSAATAQATPVLLFANVEFSTSSVVAPACNTPPINEALLVRR